MPKPVCGNDPVLPEASNVSRRNLLTALPATALTVGMAGIAQSDPLDPVVPLYREWLAARQGWRELSDVPEHGFLDSPEMIEIEERWIQIEKVMVTERPTSKDGIAAMSALLWSFLTPGITDPDMMEDAVSRSIECRAVLAIWTACTGKEGYPEI